MTAIGIVFWDGMTSFGLHIWDSMTAIRLIFGTAIIILVVLMTQKLSP
ncbi:MAG: hypothetical protein GXY91_06485 [Clostridia bacterium]|nr:hypothetical protein [Clostridia bacterium]